VREEVWQLIADSRDTGELLLALNATFLTLVPKEEQVSHPKQFLPIALCNVIYKLITKVFFETISFFSQSHNPQTLREF
jgi:hypothetical protein